MPTEPKEVNIIFRIEDINVTKFDLIHFDLPPNSPDIDYQYAIKSLSKIDPESKNISIINFVEVYLDKEQTKKIIDFETEIKYSIKNFEEISTKQENVVQIPEVVVKTFLSVSISTVRGILYSRTVDTEYKKVYLPVIDISKLTPKVFDPRELNL